MKLNSSRILPIALSAVLVLGACGGDDDAAGEVPVDSVDEQPGMRAPTPIQIAGGGEGDLASRASSEDAAATSDMMIAPIYWVSEYIVGDGFPALPANDLGYVYDATNPVTAEQVAEIAGALGVEGEPVYLDEEWGGSWRVGPDDGSAPAVWVSEGGQQSWNYNSAWQERSAIVGCAVSIDSEGNESEDCPDVEPPVGVPTPAEAEQRAAALMTALGEDVSALEVESWGDDWFASVTYRDRVDERASLSEWSFGFGPEGVLEYASGWLNDAEPVGPYPLVDLDTALARLNDGGYGFGGYGRGLIEPGIATAEAPPVDAAVEVDGAEQLPIDIPESDVVEGSSGGSDGTTGTGGDETPVPVEPTEPMPEPEPVVVTLVDVQADLWWAWDVDGSVWLLPAYRFIDADGGWHVVPAVTDEFMIEVEPPVFVVEPEPMPVEVDPEVLPVDPDPTPDMPETGVPAPDTAVPVEPPTTILPEELAAGDLTGDRAGMTVDEFTEFAAARGYSVRVVQQDGERFDVTADYSETRLNVAVEGGVVTAIVSIG